MELSSEEKKQVEYGTEVKNFINSDAYTEFVYPQLMALLNKDLPKPDTTGWEDAYRLAYAETTAVNTLHSMMQRMADNADALLAKSQEEPMDIQDA